MLPRGLLWLSLARRAWRTHIRIDTTVPTMTTNEPMVTTVWPIAVSSRDVGPDGDAPGDASGDGASAAVIASRSYAM